MTSFLIIPFCGARRRGPIGGSATMSFQANGELVPVGGGDNIPLIREKLTIGRRDSCDVRLPFPNISGLHAELRFENGYWYVRDLKPTNAVKVNAVHVQGKLL